jgi:hypothetical protein
MAGKAVASFERRAGSVKRGGGALEERDWAGERAEDKVRATATASSDDLRRIGGDMGGTL